MTKIKTIIIIMLLGVIAWQQYNKVQIVEQYEQKIVEMQDVAFDSCDDAINEILEQF